jgi:hypothetical protein
MTSRDHQHWRTIHHLRQEDDSRTLVSLGLEDFESLDDCLRRNKQMLARLQRAGMPSDLWQKFYGSAIERQERCFDGDWLASRGHRTVLIPQAYRLFRGHDGPLHFVTIVHPKWELPVGGLNDANVAAARQWLHRRLQRLPFPVIVVGGYEASLRVELNGVTYWAGHLHLVIAGADVDELKTILKIEKRYRKRNIPNR